MRLRVIFLLFLYYISNTDGMNQNIRLKRSEQFKYIISQALAQNSVPAQLRNVPNYTKYNFVYPFAPSYLYPNNSYSQTYKIQQNPQSNYLIYHYPLNNQPTIDICALPQQIGSGPYKIPRWTYNSKTVKCDLFYWSGCCANENNFQSEEECIKRCQRTNNKPNTDVYAPFTLTFTMRPSDTNNGKKQLPFINVQPSSNIFKNISSAARSDLKIPFAEYITSVSSQLPKPKLPSSINDGHLNSVEWNSITPELPLTTNVDSFKSSKKILLNKLNEPFRPIYSSTEYKTNNNIFYPQKTLKKLNELGIVQTLIPVISTPQPTPLILQPALPLSPPPQIPLAIQPQTQPLLQSLAIPPPIQILPSSPFFSLPPPLPPHPILTPQPKISIEVNRCKLPFDSGTGSKDFKRFYFNPSLKICEEFQYSGRGGNLNNFANLAECQYFCPETPNPCAYSTLNKSIPCNVPGLGCSSEQFCHVGPSITTSICCTKPSIIDPCNQSLNTGIGNEELKRFYYNPTTQQCQSFYYRGYQGNENNFLSLMDCQETCQVNPCVNGEAYRDQMGILYCSRMNVCPSGFYCHIGMNTRTSVCCPVIESDPCIQKLEAGSGFAQLVRWYFDPTEHKCLSFIYSGLKGTQNNFLTKEDCNTACNAELDPCRLPTQKPLKKCIPKLNACDGRHDLYCHIGATQDTTVCCLVEALNKCLQPVENGIGKMQSQRWYYDSNLSQCRMFTYAGMKGNQNNFITQNECEEDCLLNPCPTGKPFMTMDRIQTCSAGTALNTCPIDYWCHVGPDATTTVCCPNESSNSCRLPMSTGEGLANLERYYYDFASKTCRLFYYRGFKGNQNNFLTIHGCQLLCQPLDNPCIGKPAKSLNGQVLFCSATNRDTCPVNFWCHLGANPETSVCCPGATNACSVPLAPGTGNAGVLRWYYNSDERQCISFQYNGKRGNQNNFLSKTECDRSCPEQLCLLSIDRGACNQRQMRYAYNRQTGECVPFEYTGCGGNLNNFSTLSDCITTCGHVEF